MGFRTLAIALATAVADQWTKEAVRGGFALHESLPVIPHFFSLTYVRNTGAAWGLMSDWTLPLAGVGVAVAVAVVVFRKKLFFPGARGLWVMGLLLGGIAGNLADRLRLGYVTDFLDFYAGTAHFPAFNVADAAICTACGLQILFVWLADRAGKKADAGNAEKN